MALAEAMDGVALSGVVGDTGFYVSYDNSETTADAIKGALKSNNGKEARDRIENVFPIERRKKDLIEIINEVMTCKSQ